MTHWDNLAPREAPRVHGARETRQSRLTGVAQYPGYCAETSQLRTIIASAVVSTVRTMSSALPMKQIGISRLTPRSR